MRAELTKVRPAGGEAGGPNDQVGNQVAEAIVGRCTRCGRTLTAAASLSAGMGKVCHRRSLALGVTLDLNRARARRELRAIADRLAREGDPAAASMVALAAEAVV